VTHQPRDGDAPESEAVTGDAAFQTVVLEEMAAATNYRGWLGSLMLPFLGDRPLEVGSGTGDYAELWAAAGLQVTATEGYQPLVEQLHRRFDGHPNVRVRPLMAPVTERANHSAVVALNVLEHIPDDVAALRSFAGLVRAGGAVVVFVPAFPLLMSSFDMTVGHQRRYRRRTLTAAMVAAGLQVEVVHYVNLVGFFGWLVAMRLLRGRPRDGLLLSVFDRAIVPVMRRAEAAVAPPFGQSLLAVGRVVG
jgi:protein-L-isoaspartate O-methyltransferase